MKRRMRIADMEPGRYVIKDKDGEIAVLIYLCETLSKKWKSGDWILFYENEHHTYWDDDEYEIIDRIGEDGKEEVLK